MPANSCQINQKLKFVLIMPLVNLYNFSNIQVNIVGHRHCHTEAPSEGQESWSRLGPDLSPKSIFYPNPNPFFNPNPTP